ncbi:uncharacterized protein TNIN_307391 [Trichonephila inaurata madagascariensis]|uniref:Uncharacterized protein n=1 Tax=Trichonephila inaurata madagascariensis TaxID=2747483 RepID=A0A8X6J8E4_9ARAC|nr:uncharacterized protein TNIN_307391 [Trichonephila inaurata madagascariensis]
MNSTEVLTSILHFYETIISKAHYSPNWNEEDISNAFFWAEFCVQIYNKFSENSDIIKALDDQIHLFSNQSYCFKNLKQSSSLLCQSFLQNPSISKEFLQNAVQSINPQGLNFEEVSLDTSALGNLCLELLDSLKPISIVDSSRSVYYEIKAELLLNFLKDVIAHLDTEQQYESQLSFVFDILCRNSETLVTILHVLCSESDSEVASGIQNFALSWILLKLLDEQNSSLVHFLWQQPPLKLREIAVKYLSFGNYYIDFLTKCASSLSLQNENGNQKWKKSSSSNEVSLEYKQILDHFQSVLSIQDELSKATQDHLMALLNQASIWQDIWAHTQP